MPGIVEREYQSARVLCNYFEAVFATDISQQQIDNAFKALIFTIQFSQQKKNNHPIKQY